MSNLTFHEEAYAKKKTLPKERTGLLGFVINHSFGLIKTQQQALGVLVLIIVGLLILRIAMGGSGASVSEVPFSPPITN